MPEPWSDGWPAWAAPPSAERSAPIIRRRLAHVLLALVALAATQPSAAGAAGNDDLRRERERVRQRKAEVASQVDVLKAKDSEVSRALDALNADVATQEGLLEDARRDVAYAEEQLAKAREAEAQILSQIAALETDVRNMALEAYTNGGSQRAALGSLFEARDPNEAARRAAMVDVVFGNARELQDQLRAAREDLGVARQEAEDAAAAARARKAEVAQRLQQVSAARNRQAVFADELDARIEARLAEAAGLAQLDQQLSVEIVRQQEALARRNRASRGGARGSAPPAGSVPLRNVRGIWVHESIADNLEALLAAAEADGFPLSGGGYRDPAQQQRLREANCPDPESSPASSCSPPTARPGQSMHERGLAIDFTYEGRIISSRSSPAYQWLARNAGRFGLSNLPSEPWHWSTNGN